MGCPLLKLPLVALDGTISGGRQCGTLGKVCAHVIGREVLVRESVGMPISAKRIALAWVLYVTTSIVTSNCLLCFSPEKIPESLKKYGQDELSQAWVKGQKAPRMPRLKLRCGVTSARPGLMSQAHQEGCSHSLGWSEGLRNAGIDGSSLRGSPWGDFLSLPLPSYLTFRHPLVPFLPALFCTFQF